jgi:hypothetical protein
VDRGGQDAADPQRPQRGVERLDAPLQFVFDLGNLGTRILRTRLRRGNCDEPDCNR